MDNNSYSYFIMSIMANMAQLVNFQMSLTELSNKDLMEHLIKQDETLNKILEQNKQIIDLLKNK